MSAHEHLQPLQLRMFMRPGEILQDAVPASSVASGASLEAVRWRKTHDKRAKAIEASVRDEGVKSPVAIYHESRDLPTWMGEQEGRRVIEDGQHRLFLAEKHRPNDHIPVEHRDFHNQAPSTDAGRAKYDAFLKEWSPPRGV